MKSTVSDITVTLQGQDPSIIEIERGLIGGCLVDTRGTKAWPMTLRPHEFYLDGHRIIWQAMLDLSEETGQPDLVLLIDTLRRAGDLEAVGGGAALAEMVDAGQGRSISPTTPRLFARPPRTARGWRSARSWPPTPTCQRSRSRRRCARSIRL